MLLKNKNLYMLTLWLIVILFGTAITIIGGLKFNEEWTKNDVKKQVHLIPDFLLIDFEAKVQFDSVLTNQVLAEIKPKYHVEGETFEQQKDITTIGFFDERMFKEHKQAKKNYKLSKNIYDQFRNFKLEATSSSKDSSILIQLTKNTNKVIFTSEDRNFKDSYIEVRDYNQENKEFHIIYHNIQLNVENYKLSKFITDLDKGNLTLNLIMKAKIKDLKNIKLKTKTTEYFRASEITNNSFSYNAKLNLLLR